MSPIYVRPAREQAEHDRLIRFLQAQFSGRFEVAVNEGDLKDVALKLGESTYFRDLILLDGKKLAGVIEIETGESTNNLEALAQWVHFGKAKVPFSLYVPELMLDTARRFCEQHQVAVSEVWTYRPLFDGFDLVRAFHDPQAVARAPKAPGPKVVFIPRPEPPKPDPIPEPPPAPVEVPVSRPKSYTVKAAKPAPVKPVPAAPAKAVTPVAKPVKAVVPSKPVKAAKVAPAKATKAVAGKVAPSPKAKVSKAAKSNKPARPSKAAPKPVARKAPATKGKSAKSAKSVKATKPVKAKKKGR